MSDYICIDREALKRDLIDNRSFYPAIVKAAIESAPVVDAVPVVRCKDCKHRDGTPGQPNIVCYQMHDDDFCSYGEKR